MNCAFFTFVQLIASLHSSLNIKNANKSNDYTQICFYAENKNQCPSFINKMHYYGPNDYYSEFFLNSRESIEIFIVEQINLTRSLILSSPVSFFIYGKAIIGNVELGYKTHLYIEDASFTNIKIDFSVKTKQLSTVFTKSKVKSIFINILNYDQINEISKFELLFYRGKETKYLLSKIENQPEIQNYFSFFNIENSYYLKHESNFTVQKKIKSTGYLGDNINYEMKEIQYVDSVVISGFGPMYNFTKMPFSTFNILTAIIEEGVTTIGSYTFYDLFMLKKVQISNSVKYIGSYAFAKCDGLTQINIPDSVLSIDSMSFYACPTLNNIKISKNLLYLGFQAFYNCYSLKSITFYNGMTNILSNTFRNCYDLSFVDLYSCTQLDSIQNGAFYNCFSLTSIEIPNSVKKIGISAFMGCYYLDTITLSNNLLEIDNTTFAYCCKLSSIKIPDKVVSIGTFAFHYCYSLESIYIPKTVMKIGNMAFTFCTKLKSFSVDENNEYFSSIDDILYSKDQKTIYCYPPKKTSTTFEVPQMVNKIYYCCFSSCTNLKHIKIPNSVNIISVYAFDHCERLESVTIFGTCLISAQCFNYCYDLLSIVYLSNSVLSYTSIMVTEYNSLSIYVPNSFGSDSFCGFNTIKTDDILCRSIHHKCIECNNNKCTKCEDEWKIDDGKCTRDCKLIQEHCGKCTSTGTCLSCEKGYIFDDGKCIETNVCDDIIENCAVCNKSLDTFLCRHCFDDFVLSSDGLSCIRNANVSIPQKFVFTQPVNYLDSLENTTSIIIQKQLFLLLGTTFLNIPKQVVSMEIRQNTENIYVMYGDFNFDLLIPPINNKNISSIGISTERADEINLSINCPRGSSIRLLNDQLTTIRGGGTIEINTGLFDRIILDDEFAEPLILKTNTPKIIVNVTEVRYKQKLSLESSSCETILIHPYSELILEKMRVDTIHLMFLSSVTIRYEQTIVSHFKIYPAYHNFYNIPIKFHQPFPNLADTDFEFDEIEVDMLNDEFVNNFTVAKFVGNNENENKNACLSMKLVDNEKKYSIGCIKDNFGPNYNLKVSIVSEKEINNKYIPGVIASYVIGGVVFIAIIILAIYYIILSIKYKKCAKLDESSADENQI